jgi:hypothetical protein
MSYRVLVAIESCQKDRWKHKAIRDTWLKDLCVTEVKFFMGCVPTAIDAPLDDEVLLPVDDFYEALPFKTQTICRWALRHDFDFVFKCDTDTLINPWELVLSAFTPTWDYMGGENEDDSPYGRIQFASGGAGYFLSKKALTLVAEAASIKTAAEDVFVAYTLRNAGIRPTFHQGYKWRPGSVVDKDTVTLHLSSALQQKYVPEMMYQAYEQIKRTL